MATEFLGRPVELNFEFRQISEEEIAQIEFRSISAIKKQNDMDREAILIEEIKRHPLIQKAEQLFDSKVDKVILHKRQKEK